MALTLDQVKNHIGAAVVVSDGTDAPPKHHKNKYSAWERKNFTGTIREISDHLVGVNYKTITGAGPVSKVIMVNYVPASRLTLI